MNETALYSFRRAVIARMFFQIHIDESQLFVLWGFEEGGGQAFRPACKDVLPLLASSGVPIVLLSGLSRVDLAPWARRFDAVGYISKADSNQSVGKRIRSLCEGLW